MENKNLYLSKIVPVFVYKDASTDTKALQTIFNAQVSSYISALTTTHPNHSLEIILTLNLLTHSENKPKDVWYYKNPLTHDAFLTLKELIADVALRSEVLAPQLAEISFLQNYCALIHKTFVTKNENIGKITLNEDTGFNPHGLVNFEEDISGFRSIIRSNSTSKLTMMVHPDIKRININRSTSPDLLSKTKNDQILVNTDNFDSLIKTLNAQPKIVTVSSDITSTTSENTTVPSDITSTASTTNATLSDVSLQNKNPHDTKKKKSKTPKKLNTANNARVAKDINIPLTDAGLEILKNVVDQDNITNNIQ